MLRLTKVIGNLDSIKDSIKTSSRLHKIALEWYEAYKRIARYKTDKGLDVAICFDKPLLYGLNEGDILYLDSKIIIAISILPCDTLSIIAKDSLDIAKLCYEIGNAHIPLFYENNNTFLIPYEKTLESSFNKMGFTTKKDIKKLYANKRFYVSLPLQKEPSLKISANLEITYKDAL